MSETFETNLTRIDQLMDVLAWVRYASLGLVVTRVLISQDFYKDEIRPMMIASTGNPDQPKITKHGEIAGIPVVVVENLGVPFALVPGGRNPIISGGG